METEGKGIFFYVEADGLATLLAVLTWKVANVCKELGIQVRKFPGRMLKMLPGFFL